MGMNTVIDVAVGLILMYLLLSLVCTIVNEFIGTFLGWRARNLKNSIDRLADDEGFRSALKAWSRADLVNDWERIRDERIEVVQGNSNPFVSQ